MLQNIAVHIFFDRYIVLVGPTGARICTIYCWSTGGASGDWRSYRMDDLTSLKLDKCILLLICVINFVKTLTWGKEELFNLLYAKLD